MCLYEANEQFRRDKYCNRINFSQVRDSPGLYIVILKSLLPFRLVDKNILTILRERRNECIFNNPYPSQQEENCGKIMEDYTEAETNYFIKCMICN